jgi:hypothetical protein
MKKFNYLSLMIILIFFFAVPNNSFANYEGTGKDKGKKPVLHKPTVNPRQSLININNATMWVAEDGFHDWVVASGWNGAFPTGTTVGAIFAEGIVWGGKVSDGSTPVVRVNGNTYGTGCEPVTRLYRVRPDYLTGDLASDAASFNQIAIGDVTDANIQALRNQYAIDWNEWPVNEGAPFEDVNNNGTYEPGEDIPGIPGASQTLFIKYNDNLSEANYGSPAIGLEIAETYWAYAASGPLANVIYKKVNIVYTGTPTSASNSVIDSMYIVQWADPDVGNSTDDFAGCDTTLNLGYAYSSGSSDATYAGLGLAPPAAGYDFLQGVSQFTGNPSDSAIFDLKWRKGYKYVNSKPMSSYVYFAAGGNWSDPGFNYNGTLEFYNLMRGRLPIPRYPSGDPFPVEVADVTADGIFLLAGDPVTGQGKLDGSSEGPGDRRIMVTNGPITLSLGDTAQVVVGLVYGIGRNNLSSISVMKFNDASAQFAYDQLFEVPLMPKPVVNFSELDGEITAYWNQTADQINITENAVHGPYDFQAYALYQLPFGSTDITKGTRITTFDVIDNVSFLSEKVLDEQTGIVYTRPLIPLNNVEGIKRNFVFNRDYINNRDLIRGQSYTFAITSIGYKDDPGLPSFILESAPAILNVTPQTTDPGVRLTSSIGDTITTVSRVSGGSDGWVYPIVVDPTRLTGLNYTVSFDTLPGAVVVWNVDRSDGQRVLTNQTDQLADDQSPIADGIQFRVMGAPNDFKRFSVVANGSGPLDPFAAGSFHFAGFPTPGDLDPVSGVQQSTNGSRWGIHTADNGTRGSYAAFLDRTTRTGSRWPLIIPNDFELRFTAAGGWAYDAFNTGTASFQVPFELWNIGIATPNDPSDDFRMIPWLLDDDASGTFNIPLPGTKSTGTDDHTVSGGANDPYTDWIYWAAPENSAPGQAGYLTAEALMIAGTYDGGNDHEVMARMVLVEWNGGTAPPYIADLPETGTIFRIESTKPNVPGGDVFTFSTSAPTYSKDLAKEDVNRINVFPNPYYGFQYRETAPNNKYVTFSHLPDNAVIRIFDLSGVLVKTINHVSTSGQFDTWNLQNDYSYPVASGIYIVYIDMPDLGTTKILKLAVIQEQQLLKVY